MRQRPFHVLVEAPGGFAVSFEEAAAALETLDRMFFEPDGSFVWTGTAESPAESPTERTECAWQLDGVLYDRDGRLAYVELKGNAPPGELERLLAAFGWPATPLTFQLVREGVVLDEAVFRRWLAGE